MPPGRTCAGLLHRAHRQNKPCLFADRSCGSCLLGALAGGTAVPGGCGRASDGTAVRNKQAGKMDSCPCLERRSMLSLVRVVRGGGRSGVVVACGHASEDAALPVGRHGAGAGGGPRAAAGARAAADRRGHRRLPADRRGPGGGARSRRRPPGPEARERPPHQRGRGQGPGLRAREAGAVRCADGWRVRSEDGHLSGDLRRDGPRHSDLHVTRTGSRQAGRPPHRHRGVGLLEPPAGCYSAPVPLEEAEGGGPWRLRS